VPDKNDYEAKVSALIKSQLKLAGVTYGELAEKLTDAGYPTKESSIRNKLSRGKFSAAFMLQCLEAIGVDSIRL